MANEICNIQGQKQLLCFSWRWVRVGSVCCCSMECLGFWKVGQSDKREDVDGRGSRSAGKLPQCSHAPAQVSSGAPPFACCALIYLYRRLNALLQPLLPRPKLRQTMQRPLRRIELQEASLSCVINPAATCRQIT